MKEKSLIKSFDINGYMAKKKGLSPKVINGQVLFFRALTVKKLKKYNNKRGYQLIELEFKKGGKKELITARDIDCHLIKIIGANEEVAYLKDNKITIEFPLSHLAPQRREWCDCAANFFMSVIVNSELVPRGQCFKRIIKRPYVEIKDSFRGKGYVFRFIKASDISPWGEKTKKREYFANRDKWIKDEYKVYKKCLKEYGAYDKIKIDLKQKPLLEFGEWSAKKAGDLGKWCPIGDDPRILSLETIKMIVQKKK